MSYYVSIAAERYSRVRGMVGEKVNIKKALGVKIDICSWGLVQKDSVCQEKYWNLESRKKSIFKKFWAFLQKLENLKFKWQLGCQIKNLSNDKTAVNMKKSSCTPKKEHEFCNNVSVEKK